MKEFKIIIKIFMAVLCYCLTSWLVPLSVTASNHLFGTYLTAILFVIAFGLFFAVWAIEDIIKFNKNITTPKTK